MDNSKTKKRKTVNSAIAVILAVLLVIGGSTFAYLRDETEDVVNKFKTNQVTVDIKESTGSEYDIIPGTSQEKDPTVTVETTLPAYVFLEVTDNTDGLVDYAITDGWTPLEGFDGVYYRETDSNETYQVLKGNMVTYASSLVNSDMVIDNGDGTFSLKENVTLSFNAQAIQKEPFKNAVDAYCQINSIWFDVTDTIDIMHNGDVGTWNMYGAFTEESGKHYINIPVVEGEKFRITGRCWGSDRLAIVKNCLGKQKTDYILAEAPAMGVNGSGNNTTTYELEVPEGGTWLCLSVADFVSNYFKVEKLGNDNVDISKHYTDETMQWNFDKKYMTITIDDTNDNIDEIVEIAERYNVPLNFATQASRIDGVCNNGETKKNVLLRAQSEGSEILVHDHAFMTANSPYSDYQHFYIENKELLENAGFKINGVITSGGADYGTQDFSISTKLAYEAGYLYGDLTAENNVFNKRFYNPRTWNDNYTWEQWQTNLDNFAKKETGWYNLGTHCYAPYDSTSKMTVDVLENIIEYCLENGIEIVTWNTLYNNCAVNK